jgi:predicted metal-binding membrane protein
MTDSLVPDERPSTLLESALRDDRSAALLLFILLPLVSWTWMAVMAGDLSHSLLLWAMWAVMMTGMMLPSAKPTLLLYGVVARKRSEESVTRQIYALFAGYLVAWTLFSLGVTAVQRVLGHVLLASSAMHVTSPTAGAALLFVAGVYQLKPFKPTGLRSYQNPLHFLSSRWRTGVSGAFRMGLEHGGYCLACCWALMLLLFAGGVMSLAVIAALTAFIAFERLTRFGVLGAMISGVLLIDAGIWLVGR